MTRFALLLAACGSHAPPLATSRDPELCYRDKTAAPQLVAPHGNRVGVCFGEGDCLVIDHVLGAVLEREGWPHAEQGFPPDLDIRPRPESFELRRTETETSVCDKQGLCKTLRLPGIEDQFTVMPAISKDGAELYYVSRQGNSAFLDAVLVGPAAKRIAHIPLSGNDAENHLYTTDRVGTAVLVRDTVSLGLGDDRSSSTLIDPLTGAQRVLMTGAARELDDTNALVTEGHKATIVATRGLSPLASQTGPGDAFSGTNDGVGVVAFGNPPTIAVVENRRFVRTWRLPVCN